jgi:hypothetical protein
MNIQTVAENLRVTIAGKEQMLEEYETKAIAAYGKSRYSDIEVTAIVATVEFLQINIGELRRILQDVEQCVYIDRYHEGYDAGWEQAILKERG